jgi:GNAT superfamily N-acetyltransferase
MKLYEVNTNALAAEFISVGVIMNQSNPKYIRPLDKEINDVFDENVNKSFRFGTAKRWVLKSENNQPIGRIAAFTNNKYINKGTEFKTGGIGFFECINDQTAANLLFDTAKQWLQQQGMEAMDGPINFGDRDKWWGLLVEGFEDEPLYGMPFNPPYYEQLFDGYGFKNYYNQYWYRRVVADPLSAKFMERHAKFAAKPEYSAKHFKKSELEKFASDFTTVYNAAWAQHGEAKEITHEQVVKIFKQMKPIMDERLIWFAYYRNEPVAMWINLPDLNQYFKHFNGKLGWWEKLRLLWMKANNQCNRFVGHSFGVTPKFQALGIDSYLIREGSRLLQEKNLYEIIEMGWAGDWNPKMINIYKSIGGNQNRRMITYRYIFDNKYPFERHPEMEYK